MKSKVTKRRNPAAQAVRSPKFRPKVVNSRKRYSRKGRKKWSQTL